MLVAAAGANAWVVDTGETVEDIAAGAGGGGGGGVGSGTVASWEGGVGSGTVASREGGGPPPEATLRCIGAEGGVGDGAAESDPEKGESAGAIAPPGLLFWEVLELGREGGAADGGSSPQISSTVGR